MRFNNVTNQALCRVTINEGSADRLPITLPPRAQSSARRSHDTNDCARIREGGEVLERIQLDRFCFASMLGGPDRRTLFMLVADWRGPENIEEIVAARTGRGLVAEHRHPGSAGRKERRTSAYRAALEAGAMSRSQGSTGASRGVRTGAVPLRAAGSLPLPAALHAEVSRSC